MRFYLGPILRIPWLRDFSCVDCVRNNFHHIYSLWVSYSAYSPQGKDGFAFSFILQQFWVADSSIVG